MKGNFVLSIDLGSYTIKAGIGYSSEHGYPSILSAVEVPSLGIERGMIVDAPRVVESLTNVIEKLHQSTDIENFEYMPVIVNVSGKGIFSAKSSKGTITLRENQPITEKDINKAIEQAKISAIVPSEHEIIHVHPNKFTLDKFGNVVNPLGMHGKRLYVEAYVVSMDRSVLRNVKAVLNRAGIYHSDEMSDRIVVNLGEDLTSLSLWFKNSLEFVNVYEFGIGYVLEELSSELSITKSSAREVLKRINIYSDYISGYVDDDEHIEIHDPKLNHKKVVPKARAVSIVADAMNSIFSSLLRDIESTNLLKRFGTGSVFLVGGGANINGVGSFAEEILKMPVVVGYPNISVNDESFRNPRYSVIAGSIRMFFDSSNLPLKSKNHSKKGFSELFRSFWNKFKEMFSN